MSNEFNKSPFPAATFGEVLKRIEDSKTVSFYMVVGANEKYPYGCIWFKTDTGFEFPVDFKFATSKAFLQIEPVAPFRKIMMDHLLSLISVHEDAKSERKEDTAVKMKPFTRDEVSQYLLIESKLTYGSGDAYSKFIEASAYGLNHLNITLFINRIIELRNKTIS